MQDFHERPEDEPPALSPPGTPNDEEDSENIVPSNREGENNLHATSDDPQQFSESDWEDPQVTTVEMMAPTKKTMTRMDLLRSHPRSTSCLVFQPLISDICSKSTLSFSLLASSRRTFLMVSNNLVTGARLRNQVYSEFPIQLDRPNPCGPIQR